ncbi:MAG: radical SAM family heme chaperone HemW [Microthrixaceae bacterium]
MTSRPWTLAPAGEVAATPVGLYIHVPFCERRCGYCAFNTYTAGEVSGQSRSNYVLGAAAEIRLAAQVLGRPDLTSIYFGGGTPTILSVGEIDQILTGVRESFAVPPTAEVTIEANPDGLDRDYLRGLRRLGISRISFGMQSTSRRVLDLLDRTHDPVLALRAVDLAHSVGFDHVSLDLIYGTPGELTADFEDSLNAAVATGVDHISAYALGIESGTKLAARVRSGALPRPSDDEAALRYVMADDLLSAAGFDWYEISNWARSPEAQSRQNLLYWANANWWGIGPGAHSHLNGVRWWNVNHPDIWAEPLLSNEPNRPDPGEAYRGLSDQGGSHVAGYEQLDADQRRLEHVMLGIRLSRGLPVDALLDPDVVDDLSREGLITVVPAYSDPAVGAADPTDANGLGTSGRGRDRLGGSRGQSEVAAPDRLVLTRKGRLIADRVVDRLT